MSDNNLLYKLALGKIPGVGNIMAKKLVSYIGNVEGVFQEKKKNLLRIPGIGPMTANNIVNSKNLISAEQELAFIEKYNINVLFFLDEAYPSRLKHCEDSPLIIFTKGNVPFDALKVISIVGTRSASEYGKDICKSFIENIAQRHPDAIIISGLAYGIDIHAHREALYNKLFTVAVLGHGLNTVYPATHKNIAKKILNQGALVSEFYSDESIDRNNFAKRNRIIAGLSDATIVVESGEKGGALITADIAQSYNRDVFAFPGKINDPYSKGCNALIKQHKASLIEGVQDLEYMLNWDQPEKQTNQVQKCLFHDLTTEEDSVYNIIKLHQEVSMDYLTSQSQIPISKISPILLNLEFLGLIKSMPGNFYRLTN